ncbi:hypothetical protein ACW4YW_09640 [Methylobacillus pratensis]
MQRETRAVLISIHPKYVERILDGSKKVEFRRVWTAEKITHLIIYSTSPEMRVSAIAEIDNVLSAGKEGLWDMAKIYGGGITRQNLRNYFHGISKGYALLIKNVRRLETPLPLSEAIPGMRAPQSYVYLTAEQFDAVQSMSFLEG